MVSGWDKHPPEHEPDIGRAGRIVLLIVVVVVAVGALGWWFV